MAVTGTNNAEASSTGVEITTATAPTDTGGLSGTAFTSINGTGSLQGTSSSPIAGTKSYIVACSSAQSKTNNWNITAIAAASFQVQVNVSVMGTTSVVGMTNTGSYLGYVRLASDGSFSILNAAASVTVTSSTGLYTTGDRLLIDYAIQNGTSTSDGRMTVIIYKYSAGAWSAIWSPAEQVGNFYRAGGIDSYRWGKFSTGAAYTALYDEFQRGNTYALIGPPSATISDTVTMASTSSMGITPLTVQSAAVTFASTSAMRVGKRRTIALIGDSTMNQGGLGEGRYRTALNAIGYLDSDIYFYAVDSKAINIADSNGRLTVDDIADAIATLGGYVDTMIVNLGSNGSGSSDATNTIRVNDVMDEADPSLVGQLLWVGISQINGQTDEVARLHFNDLADDLVEARSNGQWLDWDGYKDSVGDTGLWQGDGLHMTTTGYNVKVAYVVSFVPRSADVQITVIGSVTMASTSSMGISTLITHTAAVTMASTSTMGVASLVTKTATVTMASTSSMTVAGPVTKIAAVAMASASTMSITPLYTHVAAVTMASTSSLGIVPGGEQSATVTIASTSAMMVGLLVSRIATLQMASTSSMTITGDTSGDVTATIVMASTSSLAVMAQREALASLAMASTSVMNVNGAVTDPGGYVDVTVLSITERVRPFTVTERKRVVTITERPTL